MSSTALQQTVRASESLNAPIEVVSVCQRPVIEPDDGVAEVVVVEQDQVRPGQPDQLGHLGPGTGDVDLDPVRAHEGAVGGPVVQADRDVVRPQRRVLGCRFLEHREVGEPAVLPDGELAAQRVRSGGLQPGLRPVTQAHARALLERRQQVWRAWRCPSRAG